ncbi:MAG: ABC transporter ATP-binding protein [Acidobacteria bacterium]|nr:ABC transporter ATP-binding protein [Acidobacteriota bacterium]
MTAPVVFEGVWKKFERGERHRTLRDLLPAAARRALGRQPPAELSGREFWALRDVSFEVEPGRALGIIGPNGAGKSTVLKILSRILRPTRGQARVHGRQGALIEVAAGFHPDLTGRENVFLQGAIMGMRVGEIARKLADIVEFAGVGEFMDTPVKRYSSGMNARLGFSIAAHLDPDVLLIDEVLAVGDVAFQDRCFERMLDYKRAGVAIVFVSHNLAAVSALCDSVLVLGGGAKQALGPSDTAIAAYAAALRGGAAAPSEGEAVVSIVDFSGRPLEAMDAGGEVIVRTVARLQEDVGSLGSALRIRRLETNDIVFQTSTVSVGETPVRATAQEVVRIDWQIAANLTRGHYSVQIILMNSATRRIVARLAPAILTIRETTSERGVAHVPASCCTTVAVTGSALAAVT